MFVLFCVAGLLFGNERQQSDEAGSQDSIPDGALEQSRGTGAATGQNATFAIDESPERFEVFVVHVDRTRYRTTSCKLAAHFLLFQTSAAFAELFQISARDSCH